MAGPTFEPAQLRAFGEQYTAAWCSRDPGRVAAFFAPMGSLRVNDDPAAVGRSAITDVALGFMTAFPDLKVIMDDITIHRDTAVYAWTLLGTNTGPGGSGRSVRISGFEEWRVGPDGLIAESRGHFDSQDYELQLRGGAK